ncbi:MAG: KUP/HAK/KT family potassium transporter [Candidatus Eremiobacteraeota bacterium]|nr:KUP/HAK/KT family potassium transporter [Candidatus Eremiobacteraeota bacterium]
MVTLQRKHLIHEAREIIRPLGIVFGDIGTSPIYTLFVVFLFLKPMDKSDIFGVLSLMIWSMILVVYIQYTWLAMNLSMRGEGGIIILQEILSTLVRHKKQIRIITLLSFIGLSFIIGDGVITPAISILSAVEGLKLIPGLEGTPLFIVLLISIIITIFLFAFQKRGTDKVSAYFSPIMIMWFLALAFSGIVAICEYPAILEALSPHYAVLFFIKRKFIGFLVLSEVILTITGGEALYADMGHLGKESIRKAWNFVFVCLVLNYLGQGAHMSAVSGTTSSSILFDMVFRESRLLYIPFLILTVIATVIASQAMISAMFSIVYQGINTGIMPRLKIDHTSQELSTQIYIGFVNWFLFACVILMLLIFKESSKMALAYGLAVNVTMTITAIMLIWIYSLHKSRLLMALSVMVTFIDLAFLFSNINKIPHGGYWSLIMAMIPLLVILLYKAGQRRLYIALRPMPLAPFMERYNEMYKTASKIKGTAIFLLRDVNHISPYIVNTIFSHSILYEYNIILSISIKDKPYGIKSHFARDLAPSLRVFEIHHGYMEVVNVEEVLKEHGIDGKAVFYGIEDIGTGKFAWKLFALIKALSPAIVQFYNLTPQKLHGVITRVQI